MRSFRESGHRHSARNARGGENHPGWSSVTRCLRTIFAPLSPSPSLFFSPLSTLSSTNIFFSLPFLLPLSLSPLFLLARSFVFFFSFSLFLSSFLYLQFFQRDARKIPLLSEQKESLFRSSTKPWTRKMILKLFSFNDRKVRRHRWGNFASLCSGRGMVEAVHRLAP